MMKNCILCHKPTEGSIGAAGIKWSCICQSCKDAEDKALHDRICYEAKVYDLMGVGGSESSQVKRLPGLKK